MAIGAWTITNPSANDQRVWIKQSGDHAQLVSLVAISTPSARLS